MCLQISVARLVFSSNKMAHNKVAHNNDSAIPVETGTGDYVIVRH